jgi:hypothetical protein
MMRRFDTPAGIAGMTEEPTKEEVEQRAGEAAAQLMRTPYRKQEWPRKLRRAPQDQRQKGKK